MTIWVLLKGKGKQGYALYEDGKLVANYSWDDYDWYIEDQIKKRAGEDFDLIERNHSGPFKESLPNKGLKQERLKQNNNKKPSQINAVSIPTEDS